MPDMLKWLMPRRKALRDQDLIRRKNKLKEALELAVQYKTEEDALQLAREWHNRPLTPEETNAIVTLFREAKRERQQ